ncbi:hypothetical protein Lalb_Chr01g0002401 [Lupinus albus]|uniref:Uncharacterized protein n=1 Tax=Lupinus albus TaxID=3870 RepID=A0A6A4R308_LUPAL|nr:hypothetical protein Lalb_Chr01g0002401 [Lupinus albus]
MKTKKSLKYSLEFLSATGRCRGRNLEMKIRTTQTSTKRNKLVIFRILCCLSITLAFSAWISVKWNKFIPGFLLIKKQTWVGISLEVTKMRRRYSG